MAKIPERIIYCRHVHEHDCELGAGRKANAQDTPPLGNLRAPLLGIWREIIFGSLKIHPKNENTAGDRERAGKAGSLYTKGIARSPAENEYRRKNDVHRHRKRLDIHHGRHDAMPRNADDIANITNCKPSAGMNQTRYVVPASTVAASAAIDLR